MLRVLYSEDAREVVFLGGPFVLLRFHKPEYELESDCGSVTWRIEKGVLVAPCGPRQGRPEDLGLPARRDRTAATRSR